MFDLHRHPYNLYLIRNVEEIVVSVCFRLTRNAQVTFAEKPQIKMNNVKRQNIDVYSIIDQKKVPRVPL